MEYKADVLEVDGEEFIEDGLDLEDLGPVTHGLGLNVFFLIAAAPAPGSLEFSSAEEGEPVFLGPTCTGREWDDRLCPCARSFYGARSGGLTTAARAVMLSRSEVLDIIDARAAVLMNTRGLSLPEAEAVAVSEVREVSTLSEMVPGGSVVSRRGDRLAVLGAALGPVVPAPKVPENTGAALGEVLPLRGFEGEVGRIWPENDTAGLEAQGAGI